MTARSHIPLDQRRGLTRSEAAAYVGLCVTSFDKARGEGKYPGPTLPGGRWDRRALDAIMDKASGIGANSSPYEEWRGRRHAG